MKLVKCVAVFSMMHMSSMALANKGWNPAFLRYYNKFSEATTPSLQYISKEKMVWDCTFVTNNHKEQFGRNWTRKIAFKKDGDSNRFFPVVKKNGKVRKYNKFDLGNPIPEFFKDKPITNEDGTSTLLELEAQMRYFYGYSRPDSPSITAIRKKNNNLYMEFRSLDKYRCEAKSQIDRESCIDGMMKCSLTQKYLNLVQKQKEKKK